MFPEQLGCDSDDLVALFFGSDPSHPVLNSLNL